MKAASADSAVASGMRASSTRRVVRSTSTPTLDSLPAPLIRSPSQCPGISLSFTSGGRTWMLTISGICPRQSSPAERGRRVLLPWRRQSMSAFRVRVDRFVDRLVGHVHSGVVGPDAAQCLRDLLRRPQPTQHVRNHGPEPAARVQFEPRGRVAPPLLTRLLGGSGAVLAGLRVAPQLSPQTARAAAQHLPDLPKALALLSQRRQRHALLGLHLPQSSHLTGAARCCTSDLRPPWLSGVTRKPF